MAKNDLEKVKEQLKELSEIINSFKSEAVQLKLIDVIFQDKAVDLNPIPETKASKKEEEVKETPQENKPVATGKKRGRKPGTKLTPKATVEVAETVVKVKGKPGRKPNPLKAEKVKPAAKEKKVKAKVKRPRVKSNRPGPSKILDRLVVEGFFSQPRPIGDVTAFCKEAYGYEYKTTDLSGILMRMVRKNRLSRQTNEEKNQFEYFNYQA
jgi:hypothetical protein